MTSLSRLVLGTLWSAVTSTAVLAQAAATPIELRDSTEYPWNSFTVVTTDRTAWYICPIYGRALAGVTIADSTALQQLIVPQLEQVWEQAGRAWWQLDTKRFRDSVAPAAWRDTPEWQANHAVFRKLFDQFLPELRSIVPADQRATFDENLKALQQADYTIVYNGKYVKNEERHPIECGNHKGRCS